VKSFLIKITIKTKECQRKTLCFLGHSPVLFSNESETSVAHTRIPVISRALKFLTMKTFRISIAFLVITMIGLAACSSAKWTNNRKGTMTSEVLETQIVPAV
jgi:hypothetical protein